VPNGSIQSVRQARPKIRDNQRKHFFLRTGPGRPAGRQAGRQSGGVKITDTSQVFNIYQSLTWFCPKT